MLLSASEPSKSYPVPAPTTPAAAIESRLATAAPGYLERVREATARLGLRRASAAGADIALDDLRALLPVDVDVPVVSRRREVGLLKAGVKRLVGWYVRYVGLQVSALGEAGVRLGDALLGRVDALDSRADALDQAVARLGDRVAALEAGTGEDPESPAR